ncbi:RNA/RNP complex-1-interacting phosphatase-like isoform X1 [Elephas maximus indicus]|uniref:RNA/RNP complex-1-interacting phosphatase-like isoform X1 n=1 Tax=Elephas maximus indicus TaxID=99487 RepID=UPI002116D935|nr:RNA/RNP complex-1-interacting phosphatase-like isoform X1 [Elephas maximus indicus]
MAKKNHIPSGWRTVTPIGHRLPGTRFIAFKVPFKGAVNQRLTPTQKFTPKDLISAIKAENVELGLIIDLTYTTRYWEVKLALYIHRSCILGFNLGSKIFRKKKSYVVS